MKISLTKVKHAKWASEETECYEAVVCIDGVPCIHASNEGHGGSTFLRDLPNHKGSVDKLEAYAATLPPTVSATLKDPHDETKPFTMDRSADDLVDELLYDWLELRYLRNALKKRSMFRTGKVIREYNLPWDALLAKYPNIVDFVKTEYPDAVWLNTLPENEAFKLWKEVSQ